MPKKKSDKITEEPIVGETIPPDVEAPEADAAKSADSAKAQEYFQQIWLAGVGAYGKLFEQAEAQFTKMSETAQEVFQSLVDQGKKVEETLKDKFEDAQVAEKTKEFAKKAEEAAKEFAKKADEHTKHFKDQYLNDEKMAQYKEKFSEAVEPFNVFAMHDQIEALNKKIGELEAELSALKGGAPAPKAEAKTQTKPKKPSAKKDA